MHSKTEEGKVEVTVVHEYIKRCYKTAAIEVKIYIYIIYFILNKHQLSKMIAGWVYKSKNKDKTVQKAHVCLFLYFKISSVTLYWIEMT